ncbi:hypothetical protein Tco_0064614 [Tanacetum coccineum]
MTQKPRKAIRTTEISQSSGRINLVAHETVYKEWEDRMEMAATTASSLDVVAIGDWSIGGCIGVYTARHILNTARHILILMGKVNTAGFKVSTVRLKLVLLDDC